MQILNSRWSKPLIFALIGGALGFAYYYFIGCSTNSCAITSNPYVSTGYGIGAGFLLGFDFGGKKEKDRQEEN